MLTVIPLLVAPKGLRKPTRAAYETYSAFVDVREWYRAQLGVTFALGAVVSLTLPETWEEVCARRSPAEENGGNIWIDAMQYGIDSGAVKFSPTKAYYAVYLRPPTPRQWLDGMGGMTGVERWMPYDRPGMACVADEKTWLVCGAQPTGYDSWVKTRNSSIGALAHEIVHIVSDLPHGIAPSVTYSWWAWPDSPFSEIEKQALLATSGSAAIRAKSGARSMAT